jgi:hypothetical protein
LLSLLLCGAGSFWIVNGVARWSADPSNVWHHYEYMAEGFLAGHTYLSAEPSPELAKLSDPYDPSANAPYRLWDASLYHGKYYLYYGPAPAIALMVPWRVLSGHMLSQRATVALLALGGMAGLGLLLYEVRRKCFPGLSGAALGAIILVAFHASWLPVILRRPGVWEVPIVSAVACLWWALYFLWKFHDSGGRGRWAVGIGLALALLMGSRVTFVFAAMVVAALALIPREGPLLRPRAFRKSGLPAVALAFAGGMALLVYNHERFGRWLEFGQSYQLWGIEYRGLHFFSPRFILFNARTYLLSLPQFGPYFPFLHPFADYTAPAGHLGTEEIYGVLFMMPVHLAGLAALGWAWRNRRSEESRPTRVVIAAAVIASVLSFLCLACWAGVCSRYITEFVAGWTLVTSIGLAAVFGSVEGPRPGRALRLLAAFAACWTVACVWLASADFRGFMKQSNPRAYGLAAHALDYPSAWWAARSGISYGPVDLDVRVPPVPAVQGTVLLASGRPDKANRLILDMTGNGTVRLTLADNQHTVLVTPDIPLDGDRLHIRVAAPWLYPPSESPYWDRMGDSHGELDPRKLFSIDWASGSAALESPLSNDATALRPALRTGTDYGSDSPYVASMRPAAPTP